MLTYRTRGPRDAGGCGGKAYREWVDVDLRGEGQVDHVGREERLAHLWWRQAQDTSAACHGHDASSRVTMTGIDVPHDSGSIQ